MRQSVQPLQLTPASLAAGLGVLGGPSTTVHPSIARLSAPRWRSVPYPMLGTHRAHRHIKGVDCDASDVDARLWGAAITYWSIVQSVELAFGKLDVLRAGEV